MVTQNVSENVSGKEPPILPKNLYEGVISNQKKEILIAAKGKVPGPAAYTLPPTIGFNAKTNGARSPAYSFGIKLKSHDAGNQEETPGPNKFFPQATRTGPSKGPAFSLKGGYRKKSSVKGVKANIWDTFGFDTPGPGKYNPKYAPSKETKAPVYSISPRRHIEQENDTPGPAAYDINPTLGMHPIVTVPAPAAYSIKPFRPVKLEYFSPGPAAYNHSPAILKNPVPLRSQVIRKSVAPAIGPTPGPTEYSPKLGFVRDHIPQFSFRCKHSDYELFVPDAVNYDFSF